MRIGGSVADQHVDFTEGPRGLFDQALEMLFRGDIRRDGDGAAVPNFALIAAAISRQGSMLREETTTLAPCSAIRSTMARPMPRDGAGDHGHFSAEVE